MTLFVSNSMRPFYISFIGLLIICLAGLVLYFVNINNVENEPRVNLKFRMIPPIEEKVSGIKKKIKIIQHLKGTSLFKALDFLVQLKFKEKRVFSQNKEDGIIEAIFDRIKTRDKFYVEFGTSNGNACNTRNLKLNNGWIGLLMDGGYYRPEINLQKEMIYPANIVKLFEKYKVPKQFDLLSVDTDFKDFWILRNILSAGYRPRVVIHEINCFLGPDASKTVPLNISQWRWDKYTQYFGFSIMAGWHLARYYGYSMVYCESELVNCMWIIDGKQGLGKGFRISDFVRGTWFWQKRCNLFHKPDPQKRKYVNVDENLKFNQF